MWLTSCPFVIILEFQEACHSVSTAFLSTEVIIEIIIMMH